MSIKLKLENAEPSQVVFIRTIMEKNGLRLHIPQSSL